MKLSQNKTVKRLVLYFFYDKEGIVDSYVPYMLEGMQKCSSDICIVCNGNLSQDGYRIFSHFTDNILIRENTGFDVWAYKAAFDRFGWDRLSQYDEIIMMNHTIMGPVYPFGEMFSEMDSRDLDFWGITKHHIQQDNPLNLACGYMPEHIQSHFIAVRRSLFESNHFQEYWNNCPKVNTYLDAVAKHEAIFTKYFSDLGFLWSVYVDTSDMEGFCYYPLLDHPVKLIQEKKCPIFKRRSFFTDHHTFLQNSDGTQSRELMNYLKIKSSYDTGLIWSNILRTNHMSSIKDCLNLNYILPKHHADAIPSPRKIALVIHAYFEDLVAYCYNYALSMPEYSDIYITVASDSLEKAVQKQFQNGPWNHVQIVRIENRGRDVSALLVGVAKYLAAYDYVCFVHDKKVSQLNEGITGYSFSERCFQNTLGSKAFVSNILNLFEREPYLGLLCPPPPNFSCYYPTLGLEWGSNYQITQELAQKLNIRCPISEDKEPVAPLGTMFWFRPEALQRLIDCNWKYEDFPAEPNQEDGTMLHAIERIYPFVVQDAGYYCAWVMNDDYAQTEWNNLAYMLKHVNRHAFEVFGTASHSDLLSRMKNPLLRRTGKLFNFFTRLRMEIKKRTPKRLWQHMRSCYHFLKKR